MPRDNLNVEVEVAAPGEKNLKAAAHQGFGWLFIGLIAGAVVGVLLSLFSIYNLGVQGLLGTLVLGLSCAGIFAIVGFITGFISYWLPDWLKSFFTILFILAIFAALIWAIIKMERADTLPEYLKFASPVFEGFQKGVKELGMYRYCLTADEKCPFFVPWDEPTIQSKQEELSVDVSFDEKNIRSDNTVSLRVSLAVKNPTLAKLTIKPRCYLKSKDEKGSELKVERMGTYSYGDEFEFPPASAGEELHTEFYCSGDVFEAEDKNIYSEKVIIELERPVSVKTTWPVWIGSTPRKGLVRSTMSFDAPYTISLASNNDMPFEENKDYSFQVSIQKKAEDVSLKRIQSISITLPEDIMAECEKPFENIDYTIELGDVSADALKNMTQYNKDLDKYVLPCTLYVAAAPREAVMAPIQLEAQYSVSSDYDTRIFKSL